MVQGVKKQATGVRRWRDLVLSEHGPSQPMTRLVLTVIAHVIDSKDDADCVRLSYQALVRATKLSRVTVANHIRTAVADGWLERRLPRGFGQAWHTYEFEWRVPWSVETALRRSTRNKEVQQLNDVLAVSE